jgi:hypothetical protein
MATRLIYTLPFVAQLLLSGRNRLRSGGLANSLQASPEAKPFIIVTGAGRSGTSAVARVLHESGISMGEHFAEPSDDNAVGFYEELPVFDLNQRILRQAGRARERVPWRITLLAVASRHRQTMKELANETAAGGWKDPAFCLTLEAWLPHLPRRPKLLICLRSPEAYLESLTRIYGYISREDTHRAWAKRNRRLLDVVRDYGLEATCIEYDTLVERPEEAIAHLAEFVGHALDAKLVEPRLRRFSQPIPDEYVRLYEEVKALGGSA